VVHESSSTRALLAEQLAVEGLRVEAVPTTFQAIARHVSDPAELVVLGLAGLVESELDLIRTLKSETKSPRILVCFPSPKRDFAVRALNAGADAYVLEPFYPSEVLALVRTLRGATMAGGAPPTDLLAQFAGEVAHAINNPLQVILLLLAKDKVTKKELMDLIPENIERIHRAVELLKRFGSMPVPSPTPDSLQPLAARVAALHNVAFEAAAGIPNALFDPAAADAALDALIDAVRPGVARLAVDDDEIVLRLEGGRTDVPDQVLFVTPEREIRPGLLLARTLLERQGGELEVLGEVVEARLPRA
jgi:CheY-like chemotaxis protein